MAEYTIIIPDDALTPLLTAVTRRAGWTSTVTDAEGNQTPNPETPLDVLRRVTGQYWSEIVAADHAAQVAAQITAAASAPPAITISVPE